MGVQAGEKNQMLKCSSRVVGMHGVCCKSSREKREGSAVKELEGSRR